MDGGDVDAATRDRVATETRVAERSLTRYDLSPDHRPRMINLSENATFAVEGPGGGRSAVLRVHRVAYHSRAAIESELDWLTALRAETDVATPEVVPNASGERVTTVEVGGRERHVTLFEVVPGAEPDEAAIRPSDFATLGAITARLHVHARSWTPPSSFTRFSWDWDSSLGERPRWGRWQEGFGVDADTEAVLGAAVALVRRRLREYGTAPDRYGLIHADLRLANLLVDGDAVTVIDFDDCGFSWFLYDFGTAVSFMEHDPRLPEWRAAWVEGYRSVEPLGPEHEAMLPTFVMLRRLLLVAWLGSHSHSRESQELGPGYTASSVDLARRYVDSGGAAI